MRFIGWPRRINSPKVFGDLINRLGLCIDRVIPIILSARTTSTLDLRLCEEVLDIHDVIVGLYLEDSNVGTALGMSSCSTSPQTPRGRDLIKYNHFRNQILIFVSQTD